MKRFLAILVLAATLCGWLRVAYGEEISACNCEHCTCCEGAAKEDSPACPCGCGKEQKHASEMPDLTFEYPEAINVPETRTQAPPVAYRSLAPHEVELTAAMALTHAPPGEPPPKLCPIPTPYLGFAAPIRA